MVLPLESVIDYKQGNPKNKNANYLKIFFVYRTIEVNCFKFTTRLRVDGQLKIITVNLNGLDNNSQWCSN